MFAGRHNALVVGDPVLTDLLKAGSTSTNEAMSSSSESSTAPTDFNISPSMENSAQYPTPAPLAGRCQLCRQMRRKFYCADCVRIGDVTHSKAKLPQRFSEKKLRLSTYERDKQILAVLVEEASAGLRQEDDLWMRIGLTKQANKARKVVLQKLQQEIADAKADIVRMEKACREAVKTQKKLPDSKKAYRTATEKCRESMQKSTAELERMQKRSRQKVQQHVDSLKSCIFPIDLKYSSKQPELKGPLAELEEACRTNFIRGQWVYSSRSVDATYSVGEPCLSADGNYGHLQDWVQQRQEQQTALTAGLDETAHAALETAAGLMHLTQFVKMLAFYLDLRLPYALCFSEFAVETLTEEGLRNKIARFNANVVFMCAAMRIDPLQIRPKQTIQNLLSVLDVVKDEAFLQHGNGGFQMSPELALSVEAALTQHLCLFDAHAELELLGRTEHEPADDDWEPVPCIGTSDLVHGPHTFSSASGSVISRNRSSSISLFSSAVAIVNNFWPTSPRTPE